MTLDGTSVASSDNDATAKGSNKLVVMSKWHWGDGTLVMA